MPRQDLSQNRTAYEYGREILRQPLEENAAIVGILGETTLLRYFQATEGLRTDLTLIAADREEDRLPAIAGTLSAGTPVYLTRPLERGRAQLLARLVRAAHPGPPRPVDGCPAHRNCPRGRL